MVSQDHHTFQPPYTLTYIHKVQFWAWQPSLCSCFVGRPHAELQCQQSVAEGHCFLQDSQTSVSSASPLPLPPLKPQNPHSNCPAAAKYSRLTAGQARRTLSTRSRLSTHANTRSQNRAIFSPIVVKFINLLFAFTHTRQSFLCGALYLVPRGAIFK